MSFARIAQVVAEDGEEHVFRLLDHGGVARDRLGQRLVDGFVEAHRVFQVGGVGILRLRRPQAQHARAQRPVFRHQLLDAVTGQQARLGMGFRRGVAFAARPLALGFLCLFVRRLRRLEIVRDHRQHQLGVVAQFGVVHRQGRRFDGACEVFPCLQDRLHVGEDEVG
jgi:hypothetical protein